MQWHLVDGCMNGVLAMISTTWSISCLLLAEGDQFSEIYDHSMLSFLRLIIEEVAAHKGFQISVDCGVNGWPCQCRLMLPQQPIIAGYTRLFRDIMMLSIIQRYCSINVLHRCHPTVNCFVLTWGFIHATILLIHSSSAVYWPDRIIWHWFAYFILVTSSSSKVHEFFINGL